LRRSTVGPNGNVATFDAAQIGKPSEPRADDMNLQIEPQHALSPSEIDAIEDRLYQHNSHVTGRHDGQGLGFVIRDELGRMIGVAAGYTWAGTSELKQMWIGETHRGRGYARALLNAFVTEACSRGVRRIWVASYDFQAPEMYEKAGFKRMAEFKQWPEGYINVVLCRTLSEFQQNEIGTSKLDLFRSSRDNDGGRVFPARANTGDPNRPVEA
jgi:GNAT superfamily N-acetyltransferase